MTFAIKHEKDNPGLDEAVLTVDTFSGVKTTYLSLDSTGDDGNYVDISLSPEEVTSRIEALIPLASEPFGLRPSAGG